MRNHASTTPPRKGVSSRIVHLISMVNNPQALQDHGPRNTDIRDQRKQPPQKTEIRAEPPALHPPTAGENNPPKMNQTLKPSQLQKPPQPQDQPPTISREVKSITRRATKPAQPPAAAPPAPAAEDEGGGTTAVRCREEVGAVVDIFRNGKPPKKRRPTTSGDQSNASSERISFEEQDFQAFDKLPQNKRDCLYFVAQVKNIISPDSTVIDYLSRIDLVKVNKLMALTRAVGGELRLQRTVDRKSEPAASVGQEASSPQQPLVKRRSEFDTNQSSRKRPRQSGDPEASVFSFGESSPSKIPPGSESLRLAEGSGTAGLNTPLPLTRNSDASLFVDFGTSMAISTAGQSLGRASKRSAELARGSHEAEPSAQALSVAPPQPIPNEISLKTEPGLMDFLAFVREKCYSYSQIRRMCVADGIMKDAQIYRLLCSDHPFPLTNFARLKYLTMVMAEMGNKLESSFSDFGAIQVRRSEQLTHVARAERFVRKCFLIKLSSDVRAPAEAEMTKFTNTIFASSLSRLGITDLLYPSDSRPLEDLTDQIISEDQLLQDSVSSARRLQSFLEVAYAQDTVRQAPTSTVRELLESLRREQARNKQLRRAVENTLDVRALISQQMRRLEKLREQVETERREANKRVIFDEDGVDLFIKRAHLEIRNYFTSRLSEVKNRRAMTLSQLGLRVAADGDGWNGSLRLSFSPIVAQCLSDCFGLDGEKEVGIFAGVTLAQTKSADSSDTMADFARLAEVDTPSEPDPPCAPDEKWWLYQINRVPLTPVKRRSEEYKLRDRETPLPNKSRESIS